MADPAAANSPYVYRDVSMRSASDGWMAALFTDESAQTPLALMLHYDGARWQEVRMPSQPYIHASILQIAMTSATEGWAIGYQVSSDPALAQKHDPAFEAPIPVLWHYADGIWSVYAGSRGSEFRTSPRVFLPERAKPSILRCGFCWSQRISRVQLWLIRCTITII